MKDCNRNEAKLTLVRWVLGVNFGDEGFRGVAKVTAPSCPCLPPLAATPPPLHTHTPLWTLSTSSLALQQ